MSEIQIFSMSISIHKLRENKSWGHGAQATVILYKSSDNHRLVATSGDEVTFNNVLKKGSHFKASGELFLQFNTGYGSMFLLSFADNADLSLFKEETDKIISKFPSPSKIHEAKAEQDYNATEKDQLSFSKGQTIHQVSQAGDGWLRGVIIADDGTKTVGIFPGKYVKILTSSAVSAHDDSKDTISIRSSSSSMSTTTNNESNNITIENDENENSLVMGSRTVSSSDMIVKPVPKDKELKSLDTSDPSTLQAQINSLKAGNEKLKTELLATGGEMKKWEEELSENTRISQSIISVLQESFGSVESWKNYISDTVEQKENADKKISDISEHLVKLQGILEEHNKSEKLPPAELVTRTS